MRVELPAERIEKEVESRLQRVGKTAKIKGFRPGKVPASVVRQHYGSQVRQEVLAEIMGQSYRDAVQQENLSPVAQPQIEPEMEASDKDLRLHGDLRGAARGETHGARQDYRDGPRGRHHGVEDCRRHDRQPAAARKPTGTKSIASRRRATRSSSTSRARSRARSSRAVAARRSPSCSERQGRMLPDFEKALYGGMSAGDEKPSRSSSRRTTRRGAGRQESRLQGHVHRVEEQELPPLDDSSPNSTTWPRAVSSS